MTIVEAQFHRQSETEHNIKPGKRWHVLKTCEPDFKRELEMMSSLKHLIESLEARSITLRLWKWSLHLNGFLFRIWPGNMWAVYSAQVNIHKRTRGLFEARTRALKAVAVMFSPEFLSWRLAKWLRVK